MVDLENPNAGTAENLRKVLPTALAHSMGAIERSIPTRFVARPHEAQSLATNTFDCWSLFSVA
jgi:hypothetical protein